MIGKNIQQPNGFKAFIPAPFPAKGLSEHSPEIIQKVVKAERVMGKLDGITQLLPDVDFFLFMYELKDAAASSQIEGTKATMADALEAEAKAGAPAQGDVGDIQHYIEALAYGLKRLESLPLSLRFLREIHAKLMDDEARSTHFSDPGHFRKSQNWINGKGACGCRICSAACR